MRAQNRSRTLDGALAGGTCRDRLRQVLSVLDDRRRLPTESLVRAVEESDCPVGHDLHYASLTSGLIDDDGSGFLSLSRTGSDWLLDNGRPSPSWKRSIAPGVPPLRAWQDEALRAWAGHGRHGVVEAVTGTGKSRVGVEATREALADDHQVVIVVPTVDLVAQWVQTLRANQVPGVGVAGDGQRASLRTHRVVVGTVQTLYPDPPTRPDGKVLLVADECHRYGAGQWRRVLHPSYRRRLGLTATFERNDDGIKELLGYFGGRPVFTIGFERAIADGVVARYDVQLLGVPLSPAERADYTRAEKTLREARLQLLAADFPAEPFGAFLYAVQGAAEDDADPTVTDVARRYLKAFSQRIDVMTDASAKIDVARGLAPRVAGSGGALVFTRRVEMAEEIAATLVESGARAEPIHSDLTRSQRNERLSALRTGRVQALVAPTILDEGIDVPEIDLAVVMGGSRSRRQMIQRMGRVLRLKSDGRKATFIVVYAEDTAEDLTRDDGAESCLDLIVQSADSVTRLQRREGALGVAPGQAVEAISPQVTGSSPSSEVPVDVAVPVAVDVDPDRTRPAVPADAAATPVALGLSASTPAMTRKVLHEFVHAHGVDEHEAETALRRMLDDFLTRATVTPWPKQIDAFALRHAGLEVVVSPERFIRYVSRRNDALTWDELRNESPGHAPRDGGGRPSSRTRGKTNRAKSTGELFQEQPALLLDLLDPATISIDLATVTRACQAFDLGDPYSEEALEHTREVLARDLTARPDITSALGRFTVHGRRATWTVRGDGQAIVALEPRRPGPAVKVVAAPTDGHVAHGDHDAARESSASASDLVGQIERLAALKERGLLTDDEFATAKAKLLFSDP